LATRLGCVVVLKGHATVVTDGIQTWTCPAGGPALATAGTGDVLTGVIASLLAQRLDWRSVSTALYDAARLGVLVHAMAGDRWAQRQADRGMLAGDLLAEIPRVLRALQAPD
jgi:NAD(P)H-hydrate repair Nnr-like enzyme with NAD(P)H-hydrate dehydratase domain